MNSIYAAPARVLCGTRTKKASKFRLAIRFVIRLAVSWQNGDAGYYYFLNILHSVQWK